MAAGAFDTRRCAWYESRMGSSAAKLDDLLQAVDVLQARFAESEQAQARAAAAGGLFDKAWWLLRHRQSEAAILISDQLILRLGDEDDPVVLGQIAEVLVGRWMVRATPTAAAGSQGL
jgi:hypothetical protein